MIYFFVEYKLARMILRSAVVVKRCRHSKACIVSPLLKLGIIFDCYLGTEVDIVNGMTYLNFRKDKQSLSSLSHNVTVLPLSFTTVYLFYDVDKVFRGARMVQ